MNTKQLVSQFLVMNSEQFAEVNRLAYQQTEGYNTKESLDYLTKALKKAWRKYAGGRVDVDVEEGLKMLF